MTPPALLPLAWIAAEDGTISFTGEIDLAASERDDFQSLMTQMADRAKPVRMDLTAVPYIDSAGLFRLVQLRRDLPSGAGVTLIITSGGAAERSLLITRFDKLFSLEYAELPTLRYA